MGNLNPYYNESFIFIVEQEQLRVGELKLFTILFMKYQASKGDRFLTS